MGMEAILFNDAEQFELIANMPSTEGRKRNLVKIGQAVSEKKTFKDNMFLYTYISQGQWVDNPGGQNFDCNWKGLLLWTYIVCFNQWSNAFSENDFTTFLYTRVWGCKFDLVIERSKVKVESLFESAW